MSREKTLDGVAETVKEARSNLDATYNYGGADDTKLPTIYALQSIANSLHAIAQLLLMDELDY